MKKLLILVMVLLLTGCWNYRELNQLAITTGVSIDKVDDEYQITIMIANSKKQGEGSSSKASTAIYEGKAKTIYDAFKETALSVSKQIYLGHIDLIIISESIAKNDMTVVSDFLFRYPQTRNDFQIVLAKDCKAGDILKISTPLESFPSQNIVRNLEITDKLQGYTYPVVFNDFIKTQIEEGINPVLPTVYIVGNVEVGNKEENIKQNEPDTYLKLGTMGIFKQNKFIAYSSAEESKGINIINNKIKVFGVTSKWKDKDIVTELTSMETKKSIKNNKVLIEITGVGGIQEAPENIDLTNKDDIELVREKNNETIKDYVNKAINLAKKNQTDIFGFGNLLYKSDFKKWNEVKDKWDEDVFLNLEIEIKVDIKLQDKGTATTNIEVK